MQTVKSGKRTQSQCSVHPRHTAPHSVKTHAWTLSFNPALQQSVSVTVQRSCSAHAAAAWNVPQSLQRSKSDKWGLPSIKKISLIILWSCMSHFSKSVFFFYWLLLRKLIVFACVWSQDCMHSVIHPACSVRGAASIVTEVYCPDRCRKHLQPPLCIFISFKCLMFSHSGMFGLLFTRKLTFHSFTLGFICTIVKWPHTFIVFNF